MNRRLIWALVVVAIVASLGCGAWRRSWDDLADSNGFSGPVELSEDRGDGQLVLSVGYGKCRIHVLTHKPWYDNYTVTYLPSNTRLDHVNEATATKLGSLPAEYALGDCVTKR
jgi:hypothetical protein